MLHNMPNETPVIMSRASGWTSMTKFNSPSPLQSLVRATALPLVLLAAGALPAFAGSVSVTGANGRNTGFGTAGAGGSATATTTTPSDPSNTATATGGNGGSHCFGSAASGCFPGGSGGAGGAANAIATTLLPSGLASAEASSFAFGGGGGEGGPGMAAPPGPGGLGGAAFSSATASSAMGPASAVANATGGSRGQGRPPLGVGGTASATAAASSEGGGQVQADASAFAGQANSHASTSANAQNQIGKVITTAIAPGGNGSTLFPGASWPGASSAAAVDSGSSVMLTDSLTPGRTVSQAILAPSGRSIGTGAVSAAYGGSNQSLDYSATVVFDFTTPASEQLDLKLISDDLAASSAGIGFDSLNLQVLNETTGKSLASLSYTSSSAAKAFFNGGQVSLGASSAGSQSIEIEYFLDYNSGTSAGPGDGFGFTYALSDPPLSPAVPESSTWAMLIMGFLGLGVASWRRGGRRDSSPRPAR